ncbi:MAG: calcium-binding protein, partial [Terracidiphilus sp.]
DLTGQGGNNTFVVRAFASVSAQTAINTGDGDNFVEYIANADVSIDGGSGNNTLELIGTEFNDVFVVTSDGIYGAGRTILFSNIENFIIDGDAGNDQFYILSTNSAVTTTLYGGLGSCEFIIGGDAPSNTVDDGQRNADGSVDYFTPPPATYNLNQMQGLIIVNGGPSTTISTVLDHPVMLPTESNFADTNGYILSYTAGVNGAADTMTVETSALVTAAESLGFSGTTAQLISDLEGYSLSISSGSGAGWFFQLTSLSISSTDPTLTNLVLKEPTEIDPGWTTTPAVGSGFGITHLDANFFVNESVQVNYLTVYDNQNPDPETATLTANSLVVKDNVTDTTATIDYNNIGVLDVYLGNFGNTVTIASTMSRADFDCITMVNTGTGNDNVTVNLNNSSDGFLALNTQGGINNVDASSSTQGMVIFGGGGTNTINGGSGDDIIFGGEGRVDYYDASGNLVTALGVDFDDQIVLSSTATPGDVTSIDDVPYWQTESSFSGTIDAYSVAGGSTGTNTIVAGSGNDIIFGGQGTNNITLGNGNDVVFGDNGIVQIGANGLIANGPIISLNASDSGADNTIKAGDGNNYVFGGNGAVNITVGDGTNFVFGDNGTISFNGGVVTSASTLGSSSSAAETITVGNGTDYVFGGSDSDRIAAGDGTNFIFGDNGSISFSGGSVSLAETVDSGLGSGDSITAGNGTNYVFGGDGADNISVGIGTNFVFGGDGEIDFSSGAVTSAFTVASAIGANDNIAVGNGVNYVFGGFASNTITVAAGTNYVFGDAGSISFNDGVVTLAETVDS